ncbi:MAG: general secretion pathway protein GspK [Deltaproteobacteria bacterium]|nr:general secretion pathway protein GspK [Deltaproteobacteria bacterium]
MKYSYGNERGIALVLILWVLALLSVIVGEFCYAMRTEVNIVRNFKEQTQAHYLALAGLNLALGELIKDQFMPKAPSARKAQEEGIQKEAEKETLEAEEERKRCRINVDLPAVPFGAGAFRVRIGNESGKININGADERLLKMMLAAFELDEQEKEIILDSILDWRDKNDLHRLNGAENDYYQSLPEPYECKNGDFDSVEELLLVRGVTPEIFYGGLNRIVTVFTPPTRRKRSARGFKVIRPDLNKININAAPRRVLLALPSMTEDLVEAIIEYRKETDFKTVTDVCSVVGDVVCKAISPHITLELGPFYTIVSEGRVMGGKVRRGVQAIVEVDRRLEKKYQIVQWRDGLSSRTPDFSTTEN